MSCTSSIIGSNIGLYTFKQSLSDNIQPIGSLGNNSDIFDIEFKLFPYFVFIFLN